MINFLSRREGVFLSAGSLKSKETTCSSYLWGMSFRKTIGWCASTKVLRTSEAFFFLFHAWRLLRLLQNRHPVLSCIFPSLYFFSCFFFFPFLSRFFHTGRLLWPFSHSKKKGNALLCALSLSIFLSSLSLFDEVFLHSLSCFLLFFLDTPI